MMSRETRSKAQLLKEMDALERRLEEVEEALRAIRKGEVDAICVEGPEGDRIFTLKGADQTYRKLIEEMNQGAVTTTADGTILYANKAFTEMIQAPHECMAGASINQCIAPQHKALFAALFQRGVQENAGGEILLHGEEGSPVPVYVSINTVLLEGERVICIAVTDLTGQKRQEEVVRSERLSRAILEGAGEAIVVCDRGGIIIRANHAAQRLVESPVLMRSFDDLFAIQMVSRDNHGAARPFSLSRALKGDYFHGKEVVLKRENREALYFLLSATPLRSEKEMIGCVLVLTDVTDSKRFKRELEAERKRLAVSLKRYQDLFNGISDLIMTHDMEGRLLSVNPAVSKTLGYTSEKMIGRPVSDFMLPKFRPIFREEYLKQIREKGLLKGVVFFQAQDGTGHYVEYINTLIEKEGSEPYVSASGRDITERVYAGRALRESEGRFRAMFEQAAVGVGQIETETGRFVRVNQKYCDIIGYTQEETAEITFMEITHPDDLEQSLDDIQRLIRGEIRDSTVEKRYLRKDGTIVWVNLTISPMWGVDEKPNHHIAVVQDITRIKNAEIEKRKLEARFLHAQKMESIGRLAGGIAHDFNNLLTTIFGYSDLVMSRMGRDNPLFGDVEEIKLAGKRAAGLIRQLLAFSRRQIIQPMVLDLNRVIGDMEKMLRRLIGEDIQLATTPGSDLWEVKVDPGQIEQVIMNLIVNSRDAMPLGGKLTIETVNVDLDDGYARNHGIEPTRGPRVMLAISDTGEGMDKETRSRIFEPFFTTKETGRGTGLGLSTVYGIVEQNNGFIWVYSEPGEGTTFKIYLPRAEGTETLTQEASPGETFGGSETILVVEDDPFVRELAAKVLSVCGYTVLQAKAGEEALDVLGGHEGEVHLLLTDLVLPGMNGRELAEGLILQSPHTKVLYMSGYTDNTIVRHGMLGKGIAFIPKPFSPESLALKVREVLE